MLERDRFLIRRHAEDQEGQVAVKAAPSESPTLVKGPGPVDGRPQALSYQILDADTLEVLGMVRSRRSSWLGFLRGLVGKRLLPAWLDVFETEDEPLLLTVRIAPRLFRPSARIADADGARVGRFVPRGGSTGAGFWIIDRAGGLFAIGEAAGRESAMQIRSSEGNNLATWHRRTGGAELVVAVDHALQDEPLNKMLLLGSALAWNQMASAV